MTKYINVKLTHRQAETLIEVEGHLQEIDGADRDFLKHELAYRNRLAIVMQKIYDARLKDREGARKLLHKRY